MLAPTARQPSLFYAALGHQASLLKDDLLDPIDRLLDDEALVALAAAALASRAPKAATVGRPGIAPDRLLRCCALKHIKNWSFRTLERELRASLVYRRFTRFDDGDIPDFSTFSRSFSLLGPEVTQAVHARVVGIARRERVATGRKLRTDTTVVESNIHHPTDSTLLQDGVRVLTRAMKTLTGACAPSALRVVDHGRSVQRRVLEIHRAAKKMNEQNRERMKASYAKLVGVARGVVRQAERVGAAVESGALAVVGKVGRALVADAQLRHFMPLVRRVIGQTEARVFGGDHHVDGKVVSLFEEHSAVLRRGKVAKPTEFGRLVRVDETENGVVSGYEVTAGAPSDATLWAGALDQHEARFGRAPRMATADRGFHSAANERLAYERGVENVVLPARGPLGQARRARQKERPFRRALRWRAGIEARIATLKHRFGMARAQYKGGRGFARYVGWCVISQNLVSIARVRCRREARRDAAKTQRAA